MFSTRAAGRNLITTCGKILSCKLYVARLFVMRVIMTVPSLFPAGTQDNIDFPVQSNTFERVILKASDIICARLYIIKISRPSVHLLFRWGVYLVLYGT